MGPLPQTARGAELAGLVIDEQPVVLALQVEAQRVIPTHETALLRPQQAEQPLTYFELVTRLEEELAAARKEAEAARAEVRLGGDEVAELQRELQEAQAAVRAQREEMEQERQD